MAIGRASWTSSSAPTNNRVPVPPSRDQARESAEDINSHLRRQIRELPTTKAFDKLTGRSDGTLLLEADKPVILVLGSGWGAHSLMKVRCVEWVWGGGRVGGCCRCWECCWGPASVVAFLFTATSPLRSVFSSLPPSPAPLPCLPQVVDTEAFQVVCISPRNHFLFTPMLPR